MIVLHANSRSKAGLRRLLVGGAAIAAVIGFAGAAAAADEAGGTVEELVVTAPHYVPTTNTSATKVEIPLVETPASISVITRDQIDTLNMQNLQQAVRYTSGAVGENFGPDERYDWLTIRAFQPVEYIDGLQAPVGSTTNVGLDLWGAGSVEVLKGPAGVLYGASPPGGIVNITTRRPEQDMHGEIQAQLGSFSDKQLAGDVTGSLTADGRVQGRLTALWRDRDTQTDYVTSKRFYIAPAITFNFGPDTRLTLLSYYQKDEVHGDGGGFLPADGTIFANPNGHIPVNFNAGEPGYNRFDRNQFGVGWDFSHKFNDWLTFKQDFKYFSNKSDFFSVYGGGLQPDRRTLNRNNFIFPEHITEVAVDSRFEIHANTGDIQHVGLIGFDYRNLRNNTDFGFGAGPPLDVFAPVYGLPIPAPLFSFAYLRQTLRQAGVYGQDEMKIGHWRVTLNAREDWLGTKNFGTAAPNDNAFTYRAGVNYLFDSGLAPYAAYSTSFLPVPGADFGGTPFSPTTGKQMEAGVKYEPRHVPRDVHAFLTAAVYDLVQEKVLVNDPAHLFFSVQTGEVEVKGLELEGVARFHERLSLNASYTYTDSAITKNTVASLIGNEIPAVSPHKFSALADYTWQDGALRGFGFGAGIRYLSSAYGDPANTLPTGAVTLFDALAHYDWNHWRISVNATNVFDKIYIQRCSDLTQCFYGSRRTVFLSVGRKW